MGKDEAFNSEEEDMQEEAFCFDDSFFSNRSCKYFPCHKGIAEDDFNCMFCYCPLYALGEHCGGQYRYMQDGVKSCASCTIPHTRNAREHICQYADALKDLARIK